ncbi:MAG: formate dehydrogenase accessory sulfurtransferase FdhD [Actinobacteria bacterium]|nr:formate dehydrogenase accessory sulfurtransferase FdhD [Actinomycetota bacterium]
MRRTAKVLVRHYADGRTERRPDEVVVEEPLEIRIDDQLVATTMRTPGHDFELAVGFVNAEGLLEDARVTSVRYCGVGSAVETEFNVVSVTTAGGGPLPVPRLSTVSSSCGLCGSDQLEALADRLQPLDSVGPFGVDSLHALVTSMVDGQELFDRTGGVHAAALVSRGSVMVVREDIGRHNAVDKLVGWLLLDGEEGPSELLADTAVLVSSRASFELVQKVWAAGIGTLLAVGAPSALAISTAEAAGMNLVAFVRDGSFNVYAGSVS